MTSYDHRSISGRTKQRLAIASLVLALIALLGVVPLVHISAVLYELIVDLNLNQIRGFDIVLLSISISILAIILGFISRRGAEKGSNARILATLGVLLGFLVWPLAFYTLFLIAMSL